MAALPGNQVLLFPLYKSCPSKLNLPPNGGTQEASPMKLGVNSEPHTKPLLVDLFYEFRFLLCKFLLVQFP